MSIMSSLVNILLEVFLIILFLIVTFILIIVLSFDRKKIKGNSKLNEKESKTATNETDRKEKQLNNLFMYIVYYVIFSILLVFFIFSVFAFERNVTLSDIWPFFFLIGILGFSSILLIDHLKPLSKRTDQKDMREI